jgi:hypothetical protein
VWFDTSRFVVLGKSWIEMIFELRNGLSHPSWKWPCTQEAVYGLSWYAERVCIMFNALQQSSPSVLPAPDATNGLAVQNTLPINSGDDVEAMVVCPPDTPSPQPTNNNFFQSSFFDPSQNANGPSNTFGSSNGSSAAFGSSAIGLGSSGSFGSSAGTLGSSFGSNSASSFTPGQSQAGTAAPTQQAILFTNLKDLVIALTARSLLRGYQIETNRLQVKLKKPGLSVGPDEYKHFAKGILYFEFGQSRGLFINKQQVLQDGWSWFDLVVKLREILNTLLGAQATNADTFTAFRKQVAKVFRFVRANTVAPPTQNSSSLPATIGTSSAVLNASAISMGDAPDDIATTPALDKGKSKTVDSPAPVQNTLAIFAGDSTKFSSHAMIEEIMGWLNGDAIPAGPGDGPAPGPPAPPAPPSGSGGFSQLVCFAFGVIASRIWWCSFLVALLGLLPRPTLRVTLLSPMRPLRLLTALYHRPLTRARARSCHRPPLLNLSPALTSQHSRSSMT